MIYSVLIRDPELSILRRTIEWEEFRAVKLSQSLNNGVPHEMWMTE